MDEFTAIREFRAHVSAAGDAARSRARARLLAHVEAEATGRTRRLRGSWPVRRLAWTAAVASAAVAVLTLVPTWSSGDGGTTLLERAAAAVSTGPVLHAVLEVPAADVHIGSPGDDIAVLDLATGRTRPVDWTIEIWFDPDRQMLHERYSLNGSVLHDSLQVPERSRDNRGDSASNTDRPEVGNALAAFLSGGYERALADGSAQAVGDGSVDGRRVTWLRFAPSPGSDVAAEVAVDSETYRPVRIRHICPRCTTAPPVYRVATLEGVSFEAADFTPPAPGTRRGTASYNARYEDATISELATALDRPTLWAGTSVGGLELTLTRVVTTSRHSTVPPTEANRIESSRAVALLYGTEHKAGAEQAPYVSIGQAVDPGYRFDGFNFDVMSDGVATGDLGARIPPEGHALISSLGGWWTIQLRKGGLYVEIDGSSRELALEAVAALRPMTPTR